jgi:hypothetical protein
MNSAASTMYIFAFVVVLTALYVRLQFIVGSSRATAHAAVVYACGVVLLTYMFSTLPFRYGMRHTSVLVLLILVVVFEEHITAWTYAAIVAYVTGLFVMDILVYPNDRIGAPTHVDRDDDEDEQ